MPSPEPSELEAAEQRLKADGVSFEPDPFESARRCPHVTRDELPKFAVLAFATVYKSDDQAPRFNDHLVLCAYCAGLVRATLAQTLKLGADWGLR